MLFIMVTLSDTTRSSVVPPAGFEPALPPPEAGRSRGRGRVLGSYLGFLFASCVPGGLLWAVVRSTRHSTTNVLSGRVRGPLAQRSRVDRTNSMRHPPVHPDGVVDLVADIRMGLLHRLGIGVDAAVPAGPTRGDAGSRGSAPPRRSARVELRRRRRGYDREACCRWIALSRMLRRQLRWALASLKETGSAYFSPVL